jgi:tetratricopeptide (TPR) repeat protein
MGFMGYVVWQFENIQPRVLAIVGTAPTATPPAVSFARNGNLAFVRGDIENAIVNYRQAVLQAPANVDMLYELARMLIYHSYADRRNAPDIDEAIKWADQAVLNNPANPRAYTIQCFALLSTNGREEDAVRSCLKAIQMNPKDGDAHAYLAAAYSSLTRIDAALDEGLVAVQLNDMSIDAHTFYAFVLWYKGKFASALDHFKKAAEINPRLEFPYFNMAYFIVGSAKDPADYNGAINAYNRILSLNKNSVKAYTRLCETYYRMGETERARDNCETATTLDNDYTLAYKWLGQVEYTRRDYEDAIKNLGICAKQEEADLTLNKEDRLTECWYIRGLAHYFLDQCDDAMEIFNDLLTWTTDKNAIDKTNIGIYNCAVKNQGKYQTPTPVPPTNTPEPLIQ